MTFWIIKFHARATRDTGLMMTIIKTVSTSKNAKRTMAGRLNVLLKDAQAVAI